MHNPYTFNSETRERKRKTKERPNLYGFRTFAFLFISSYQSAAYKSQQMSAMINSLVRAFPTAVINVKITDKFLNKIIKLSSHLS